MGKLPEKLFKALFSRSVMVGFLLVLQFAILLIFILRLSMYFAALYGALTVISILVVLMVINKDDNPAYKIAWLVPILLFPLFGGLLYLMFGNVRLPKNYVVRMREIGEKTDDSLWETEEAQRLLRREDFRVQKQSNYLDNIGFPVYTDTQTRFFSPGERLFEAMLEALESAEHYIFLEYFIIRDGDDMWKAILDILVRKVKAGVEVRVLYDGFGCITSLPYGYYRKLRSLGIQCMEFHPVVPLLSVRINNRDHRKIAVIDGKIGYTGGINLADEYINAKDRYGHWKDSAVELRGGAVWSLAVMFLQMWMAVYGEEEDIQKYFQGLPKDSNPEYGFVQPYADSPLDNESVGAMVYMNAICHANKTLFISTPYLILDHETTVALMLAAKSGVDVRVITPGRGDKWFVHMTTRAHYRQLVSAGVKIYEYVPGFIHSKVFVADEDIAIVGTVNLDYRSLYLHFECGAWMCRTSAVREIREDFLSTLAQCREITMDSPLIRASFFRRIISAVLRVFAPLM
jgi:cardiolipin synthase